MSVQTTSKNISKNRNSDRIDTKSDSFSFPIGTTIEWVDNLDAGSKGGSSEHFKSTKSQNYAWQGKRIEKGSIQAIKSRTKSRWHSVERARNLPLFIVGNHCNWINGWAVAANFVLKYAKLIDFMQLPGALFS